MSNQASAKGANEVMESEDDFTKYGTFDISPDKQVFGELRVAGPDSYLYLRDAAFFHTISLPNGCITGILHDLTKVTLISCLTTEALGSSTRRGETYHYSRLFPHFVVLGDRHLTVNEKVIRDIAIIIDDADALFYDFDAFGQLIDARPYIAEIVKANKLDREIGIGEYPLIAYFTGKSEIIAVETPLGKVVANHNPSRSMGGPSGVHIGNFISVTITPHAPVTFSEATARTLDLLRFFEVLIGRPQKIKEFWLRVAGDVDIDERLRVYWSLAPSPKQAPSDERSRPHPADVLIDPIVHPEEFSSVLAKWFEIDKERRDARLRFSTSFRRENEYDTDRLVGAANMFDILPVSASPKNVELVQGLLEAQQRSREFFTVLTPSIERDSVLSALGRLGKSTLKHKVRFRAQYIIDTAGERFPDLLLVLDEAVNCRNHYVHGSESKIDYSSNFRLVVFFIDTLEFVFAASDLIESGWNMRRWCDTATTMSHPFGRYRVDYATHLAVFKELAK